MFTAFSIHTGFQESNPTTTRIQSTISLLYLIKSYPKSAKLRSYKSYVIKDSSSAIDPIPRGIIKHHLNTMFKFKIGYQLTSWSWTMTAIIQQDSNLESYKESKIVVKIYINHNLICLEYFPFTTWTSKLSNTQAPKHLAGYNELSMFSSSKAIIFFLEGWTSKNLYKIQEHIEEW